MNKLSIALNITGAGIIILSSVRWFFLWYDPSQAVLGIAIGVIILGFADIYSIRKVQEKQIDNLNERLDSFSKWFTKKEFEE